MHLDKIETILFDCDGVILNSNNIKTNAFYESTLPFGIEKANEFVSYHLKNGGISRYVKLKYFVEKIIKNPSGDSLVYSLLEKYAELVRKGLMTCEVLPNLASFKNRTAGIPWAIVSGGDQLELREVFQARGIDKYFDAGIFGSPRSKDEIIIEQINAGSFSLNSLFIGDAKYDFEVASRFNFEFIFFSKWTDFEDWEYFCNINRIQCVDKI